MKKQRNRDREAIRGNLHAINLMQELGDSHDLVAI